VPQDDRSCDTNLVAQLNYKLLQPASHCYCYVQLDEFAAVAAAVAVIGAAVIGAVL
jgi:hypothetical protein